MKVYSTEASDGLTDIIQQESSIAYAAAVNVIDLKEIKAKSGKQPSFANLDDSLFYATKSVLATTSWNKNDDVFARDYTWNARHTPINTFTDVEHDHDQIVGHITDTWVIDAEGNIIADDTDLASLPDKFHLCNAAVIYKFPVSKSAKAKKRAKDLIEGIEAGTKFVSMECIFTDFDYALIATDGTHHIINRNEDTAFLTKHLRIYGGTGSYKDQKIGRVLKNMVFSGKGYVDKPANPESIIFDNDTEFSFSKASYHDNADWANVADKTVVQVSKSEGEVSKKDDVQEIGVLLTRLNATLESLPESIILKTEKPLMATENTDLQKQIDELKTQNAALQSAVSEANVKSLNDTIAELKAQVASLETAKAELTETSTKAATESKTLTEELAKVTAANKELSDKIAQAELEKVYTSRVSTLVEGGCTKEDAAAKVEKFKSLDETQFAEVAAALIAAAKATSTTTTEGIDAGELDSATVVEDGATAGAVSSEEESDDSAAVKASIGSYLFPAKQAVQNKDGE